MIASFSRQVSKWKWALGLAAILGLLAAVRLLDAASLLHHWLEWIRRLGPWGPALFIAAYIIATVLFIPGSVLTLGAGAVFGIAQGSLYVSIASTLGATCAFFIGRSLARDVVARKMDGNAKFAAIDQAVAAEGWRIVALARLSPVLPFSLLNYAFGLTQISLREFVLASWIGMMPGTVLYVYLGSLADVSAGQRQLSVAEWALRGAGLTATAAATVLLARMAKKALTAKTTA